MKPTSTSNNIVIRQSGAHPKIKCHYCKLMMRLPCSNNEEKNNCPNITTDTIREMNLNKDGSSS